LTKTLALEGAGCGITANAICPGFVKTPLVEKQITDLANQHNISQADVIQNNILQKHAIKNFVRSEEIAALAIFLSSENASMITGVAMPVDGGWVAQ
jgi:3-hydroxybutyrate dehydrogenase